MRKPSKTRTRLLLIPVLLLALALFAPLVQVRAIGVQPGLHQGDWARYAISGDFSETVVTSNLTVTGRNGNLLNVTWVDNFNDGRSVPSLISINTTTGYGNIEQGLYFAIDPGKTLGQPVYQNSLALAGVNVTQTPSKTYAGATRQTNYAQDTNSSQTCTGGPCAYANNTYYWDQQTGIFTEIDQYYWNSTSPTPKLGIHAVMTATNLWSPTPIISPTPGSNLLLDIGIILVTAAILIGAFLYFTRRRKSTRKQ
jgi:hypothetical protein